MYAIRSYYAEVIGPDTPIEIVAGQGVRSGDASGVGVDAWVAGRAGGRCADQDRENVELAQRPGELEIGENETGQDQHQLDFKQLAVASYNFV